MIIENAFGRLKGRFDHRRFDHSIHSGRSIDVNIKELQHFIMSIFILYNFCEINNEMLPNARLQGVIQEDNISQLNAKSMNYKTSVNESEAKK